MGTEDKWLIIVGDGDIDYTRVYLAEGASTEAEADAMLMDVLGSDYEDDGDYFYRVIPLKSFASFQEENAS